MRKAILIILISLFSFQSFGQDPDLFQTWYLSSLEYENLSINVIDINPLITPSLTLTENLEFSGEGACNTFSGTLSFDFDYPDSPDFALDFTSFLPTENLCEYAEHNDFEDDYFLFFMTSSLLYYTIQTNPTTGVQTLLIDVPGWEQMSFRNAPLSPPMPNPEIFQTWYLSNMYSEEFNINILDIDPQISPSFTLNNDISFSGVGACNTFTGVLSYNEINDEFLVVNFTSTDLACDYQEHTDFENNYFGYFEVDGALYYNIYTEPTTGVQSLSLDIPIFAGMNFSNVQLSNPDYKLENFKIYPNPVSCQLFISSENTVIESISIYSLTGKKVVEIVNQTNFIDVSTLSKGLYFIEISSITGKSIKKFIKK